MLGTIGGIALRSALWLLLGGWIGAWGMFALVVAPTAFRVLPSTEVAGDLVGPLLSFLHLYGAVAGLALAGIAWALSRPVALRVLPLVLMAACLYTQFGVSGEIAEIRDLALRPEGSEEMAARFTRLHTLSRTIFGSVGVAAIALLVLHAREETLRTALPSRQTASQ
jgi:hypothetical protein